MKLLSKTLHDISKGGRYQGRIDRSATISEIVGLNVASIICCGKEVHVIGAVGGSTAWICRISQRIRRIWLLTMNLKTCAGVGIAAIIR